MTSDKIASLQNEFSGIVLSFPILLLYSSDQQIAFRALQVNCLLTSAAQNAIYQFEVLLSISPWITRRTTNINQTSW